MSQTVFENLPLPPSGWEFGAPSFTTNRADPLPSRTRPRGSEALLLPSAYPAPMVLQDQPPANATGAFLLLGAFAVAVAAIAIATSRPPKR